MSTVAAEETKLKVELAKRKPIVAESAAEILLETKKLEQSLSLMHLKDAAVCSHYYGAGGFGYGQSIRLNDGSPRASDKLRALEGMTHGNVMKNVIDTGLSQSVRSPNFVIESMGNPWSVQRSTRKIEQWITGSLRASNWNEVKWRVCTDMFTCSIGAARLWFDKRGLHIARVRPDQIIFNPKEGHDPRTLRIRYGVDRKALMRDNPKLAEKIRTGAPRYKQNYLFESLDLLCHLETDQVEIIEKWTLGSEESVGVHTIQTGEIFLNEGDQEWDHPFFPLAKGSFSFGWDSYAGKSLGEQILGDQLQLNKMMRIIDDAQAKMSISRIMIPNGSEVKGNQLSKSVGEVVYYNSAGGNIMVRNAVAIEPAYYERARDVERGMYQRAGISESAATNQIPVGLANASGRAQQMIDNRTAVRAKAINDTIDRLDEQVGTIGLALSLDFFKKNPGEMPKVRAGGTRVLKEIDFKDLDLDDMNGVSIRVAATSGLPTDPAARQDYATKMVEGGYWSKRYAIKILASTDIEAAEDTITAALDLAQDHIEDVLFDGKRVTPEPNQDYLETIVDLGQRAMMRAIRLGCPENNIEKMRRLLEVATYQLKRLSPAPAPANDLGAASGAMPAAGGGPPVATGGTPMAAAGWA